MYKGILTSQSLLDVAKILWKLHNFYLSTEWPTILQNRKN